MDLRFRSTSFNLISSCYCIEVISWHTRKETLTYVHFFCTQSKFSENKVGPDLNQVISARWIKKGEGILLINQYSFFLYYVIRCILWNSVFCLTSRIISFFSDNDVYVSFADNLSNVLPIFRKKIWLKVVELSSYFLSSLFPFSK